ncbi:hypothetical protein ACIQMJ_28435 [Actinosynnema sp. NPDC091369]
MAGTPGGAEMAPRDTEDAMTGLARAAGEFGGAWSAAEGTLSSLEAQLGGGRMGQAFLGVYGPGAAGTAGMVTAGVRALRAAAGAGLGSVSDYVEADRAGRRAFDGLRS